MYAYVQSVRPIKKTEIHLSFNFLSKYVYARFTDSYLGKHPKFQPGFLNVAVSECALLTVYKSAHT